MTVPQLPIWTQTASLWRRASFQELPIFGLRNPSELLEGRVIFFPSMEFWSISKKHLFPFTGENEKPRRLVLAALSSRRFLLLHPGRYGQKAVRGWKVASSEWESSALTALRGWEDLLKIMSFLKYWVLGALFCSGGRLSHKCGQAFAWNHGEKNFLFLYFIWRFKAQPGLMSLGVSGPLRKGASSTEAVRAVIQGAPAISGVVTAGIRLKDALRKGSANWKTRTETNNNNRKKKKELRAFVLVY